MLFKNAFISFWLQTPSNGVFGNIKFDSIGARPETKIKISRVTFKDGAISKSENVSKYLSIVS